ncbi:hypothetical protein CW358_16715 [Pseudomonas protegens]|nr:hypothetical protein CW358_16715 [Pseudomonas protegens]
MTTSSTNDSTERAEPEHLPAPCQSSPEQNPATSAPERNRQARQPDVVPVEPRAIVWRSLMLEQ